MSFNSLLFDGLHNMKPGSLWIDRQRWAGRKHNVVADRLCTWAMAHRTTWRNMFRAALLGSLDVVLHSNSRAHPHWGGALWIAQASYFDRLPGTWLPKPIAISGVYSETLQSSLSAEALALYHSSNCLADLLENHCMSRWS